jgi:dephospho-CoA kinase
LKWRRRGETSISASFVIGVTGKYCAGKNAAVSYLLRQGFLEIDVDRIGHEVLEEPAVKKRALEAFGPAICSREGAIDRRRLGAVVFRCSGKLRLLESIVHPPMVREVEAKLERIDGRAVINAAVLFRMGLQRFCDLVICVRSSFVRRLLRAHRRDGISVGQALRRMRAQRGICPKLNANGVDINYVDNDRGLDHLHAQIRKILSEKGYGTS